MTPGAGAARRAVVISFAVSAAGAGGVIAVYWVDAGTQAAGAMAAVALGALGTGFVLWAHHLMPGGGRVEQREQLPTSEDERGAVEERLDRDRAVSGQPVLRRSLLVAAGALGLAALVPVRSLGPRPGRALLVTPWRRGLRLVTEDGRPVEVAGVPVGGMVTVFPDGHAGSADGQAVLLRLEPGTLRPAPERAGWSPDGFIAFSKICTHAGCPVGLYQVESNQLLCPCHQSAFDVLEEAKPVFGPAARPLPQLPLAIDDGVLRADGDFSEPVGPAWWTR